LGLSSKPASGFDKKTQAGDVSGVMSALGVQQADVVAHDIGNMVAWQPDMKTLFRLPAVIPLLVALMTAGCATPPPIDQAELPAPPATFKEGDSPWRLAKPADAQPRGDWWKAFGDSVIRCSTT
jgi:pimeloyl-ACP methyl ester carboxylesterase